MLPKFYWMTESWVFPTWKIKQVIDDGEKDDFIFMKMARQNPLEKIDSSSRECQARGNNMTSQHPDQYLCKLFSIDLSYSCYFPWIDIVMSLKFFFQSKLEMSLAMWAVWKLLLYLLTALPLRSTKNFSKFQAMSDRRTGFQMMNFGSPMRLSESSDGNGSSRFSHENTACSPSPLAITCNAS